MKRLTAFTLVILAGSSAQALAAATAEEASRLTALLQAYVGKDPGVVTVTVDGESYDVRIDLAPHFAKIKDPKVKVSLTPFEMKITDQGGGKWKVVQDQSLSLAFSVEGAVDIKGSIGGLKTDGVFDEAIGSFSSSTSDITQAAFQQTVSDKGQMSDVTYTIASMHAEFSATATADGADAKMNSTFTDLHETIKVPPAPDGSTPPVEVSVTIPDGTQDVAYTGLKIKPINELLAWFVARPSLEAITADQAELKDKLRAALPLWRNVSGVSTMNNMSVNTMLGVFSMDKVDVTVGMNGVVSDGSLREAIAVSGFKMPDGITPPWATGLVPTNFTLDFNVADFDLAAPANLIIDNFDLTQKPPLKPEMEQQLLAALLPKMNVKIGLGPSEVISGIYDLKASGNMMVGPASIPSGSALVRLKGLDEIMAAIQAAPPEMGMQQAAPVVLVAKGMAKQDAEGYLTWQIDSTPTGSVTINGIDPMKMGGGQ